jgi:hypothetical protein
MGQEFDGALEEVGSGRRTFLKRVVIGTAFAAPVVASFTMSGVQAAYAQTPTASGAVSNSDVTATTTTTTSPNQTVVTTTTTTNGNQPQVPAPGPAPTPV